VLDRAHNLCALRGQLKAPKKNALFFNSDRLCLSELFLRNQCRVLIDQVLIGSAASFHHPLFVNIVGIYIVINRFIIFQEAK